MQVAADFLNSALQELVLLPQPPEASLQLNEWKVSHMISFLCPFEMISGVLTSAIKSIFLPTVRL